MEPEWEDVRARLMALPMRLIRPIGRMRFMGSMGGASAKAEYVGEMITSMRYWWDHAENGQEQVNDVLLMIENAERMYAVDEVRKG